MSLCGIKLWLDDMSVSRSNLRWNGFADSSISEKHCNYFLECAGDRDYERFFLSLEADPVSGSDDDVFDCVKAFAESDGREGYGSRA